MFSSSPHKKIWDISEVKGFYTASTAFVNLGPMNPCFMRSKWVKNRYHSGGPFFATPFLQDFCSVKAKKGTHRFQKTKRFSTFSSLAKKGPPLYIDRSIGKNSVFYHFFIIYVGFNIGDYCAHIYLWGRLKIGSYEKHIFVRQTQRVANKIQTSTFRVANKVQTFFQILTFGVAHKVQIFFLNFRILTSCPPIRYKS